MEVDLSPVANRHEKGNHVNGNYYKPYCYKDDQLLSGQSTLASFNETHVLFPGKLFGRMGEYPVDPGDNSEQKIVAYKIIAKYQKSEIHINNILLYKRVTNVTTSSIANSVVYYYRDFLKVAIYS